MTVNQLCRLVAETLRVDQAAVEPQTGPLTLTAWDSLNHTRLMLAIEDAYGVELSSDEITSLFCVGDIAALLEQKGIDVA